MKITTKNLPLKPQNTLLARYLVETSGGMRDFSPRRKSFMQMANSMFDSIDKFIHTRVQ